MENKDTIILNIKSGKKSVHSLKGATSMVKYNPNTFKILDGEALPLIVLGTDKILWLPEDEAKLLQLQKPEKYLIPTDEGLATTKNSEREIKKDVVEIRANNKIVEVEAPEEMPNAAINLDKLDDYRTIGIDIHGKVTEYKTDKATENTKPLDSVKDIVVKTTESTDKIEASLTAIKLANKNDVDLADVIGTGANGKIVLKDVKNYLKDKE